MDVTQTVLLSVSRRPRAPSAGCVWGLTVDKFENQNLMGQVHFVFNGLSCVIYGSQMPRYVLYVELY